MYLEDVIHNLSFFLNREKKVHLFEENVFKIKCRYI